MRILPSLILISGAALAPAFAPVFADAQQIGQNKSAEASENYTLSVKVQLVT